MLSKPIMNRKLRKMRENSVYCIEISHNE